MSDILAPLPPDYSLHIPEQPGVLIVWFIWLIVLIVLSIRLNKVKISLNRRTLGWFAGLSLSILLLTPFLGVDIIPSSINITGNQPFNHLMFLAALPWMIAGGILGILPAVMLAGTSGLLLAYLDTHSIFTPLIFMSICLTYVWSIRQSYQTILFKLLRSPLIAAILGLVTAIPMILFADVISIEGSFPHRLTIAFNAFPASFIALGGMLLIAGIVSSLVKKITDVDWAPETVLNPSPFETNIMARWLAVILPLLIVSFSLVIYLTWSSAEKKTRETTISKLTETAYRVSEETTFFVQIGYSLLSEAVSESARSGLSPGFLPDYFESQVFLDSFFQKMAILNPSGEVLSAFPSGAMDDLQLTNLNLPLDDNLAPQRADILFVNKNSEIPRTAIFLSPILLPSGQVNGWLVGEVDLSVNPFGTNLQRALDIFDNDQLSITIINNAGTILFGSNSKQDTDFFEGEIFYTPSYFERVDSQGNEWLNYFQPITGTDWAVLTSTPGISVEEMAWEEAAPLLLFGIGTTIMIGMILPALWSPVKRNISNWAAQLEKSSSAGGKLSLSEIRLNGELGYLSRTMINNLESLQARLENQTDLFSVNKEIAGRIDIADALQIIMKAALVHNVSSVRILLSNDSANGKIIKQNQHLGMGKHSHLMAVLDEAVYTKVENEGEVILEDFQFGKIFELSKGMPYPASMIALPISDGDEFSGVLWVTYQDLRSPSSEDLVFFRSLAQKTSRIIKNNRLFNQSIFLKMQFSEALDQIPDAIFLVDDTKKPIYNNPSASMLLDRMGLRLEDKSFNQLFSQISRLNKAGSEMNGVQTGEILLDDGNTYQVSITPLNFDDQQTGEMIILRDVTRQKERQLKKSEYVMTVSHELRSPLTLIQGYAKILRMTGNLNDQQGEYINNIIDGAEEMKSLVQNLLDLGRLEGGEPLDFSQIFVGDLVQKVIERMNAQAKQKNIQLQMNLPKAPIIIEGDQTFLTQALKNLVDNAIKFTKMGGEVTFSVFDEGQNITFSVLDNGSGISPLDQRHVFEKFHSKTVSKEGNQKGSGLGLAIVKSIAEHHGGKVWFESQLGKGSTFYLRIPKNSSGK